MIDKGTIIYIGGFELPDKNAAAHRVLSNGKIFRDLGYNVVFIGIDKLLGKNFNVIDTKNNTQGFDTWAIPYPKSIMDWPKYLTDIKNFKTIFELYGDVCLVVAYNYQAVALNRLKNYCWNNHCTVIADCTEWYSAKGSGLVFKIIKGFDSFLRMRIVQKQLDGLIVISDYLERYYEWRCPTIKLPPLVDIVESKWENDSIDNNQTCLKFIFSGTLGRNKDNVNRIIEAFYDLKDKEAYNLEIVGIDLQEYIDKYPKHIYLLEKLNEKVFFRGRKSHLKSIETLKSADFSIFIRENNNSNNAGFPTKFVESITCGVPVITTNSSDLLDYLEDSVDGFILDIENKMETTSLLKSIIDMDRDRVLDMKRNINTDEFYYKNYVEKTEVFFEKELKLSSNVRDRIL